MGTKRDGQSEARCWRRHQWWQLKNTTHMKGSIYRGLALAAHLLSVFSPPQYPESPAGFSSHCLFDVGQETENEMLLDKQPRWASVYPINKDKQEGGVSAVTGIRPLAHNGSDWLLPLLLIKHYELKNKPTRMMIVNNIKDLKRALRIDSS